MTYDEAVDMRIDGAQWERYYGGNQRLAAAYAEEISNRANALIDSGDLDALVEAMAALEADRFHKAIGVICRCNTKVSREAATLEIRHLINVAATRLAERQYMQQMNVAAENLAIERLYRQVERCGA